MLITAITSQLVSLHILPTALMAEPPVVVTSSTMTIFPPADNDEPSILVGC